jgi:hypothetical protein
VRRYVRPFRQLAVAPSPAPAIPKARQITRWLLSRPASLDPAEHAQLAGIRARCPHLDALAAHVTGFAEMMTNRTGEQELSGWLAAVEADDQPCLHSFATGIRRDLDAVTAGITLPYSSGTVEGNVNRIILWNQSCQIGAAWAWRTSTIGRMVALAGRSSCRGVGPAGVGMSASRSSSLSRAALPSSTAACSSSVRGIIARIFCRFAIPPRPQPQQGSPGHDYSRPPVGPGTGVGGRSRVIDPGGRLGPAACGRLARTGPCHGRVHPGRAEGTARARR